MVGVAMAVEPGRELRPTEQRKVRDVNAVAMAVEPGRELRPHVCPCPMVS
jgi:hypothetical protein